MTTTTPARVVLPERIADLPLSPLVNLRDLGGTPVAGGSVRDGFAWRSDDITMVDRAGAEALVDAGLSAVIDLRSSAEVAMTGRGLLAEYPVAYHHVPFMSDVSASGSMSNGDALHPVRIGHMYVGLVEHAAPAVVSALAVLAHSPGGVLFHCAAGKDRTGVLAASLLLALGAPDDTVIGDYGRTGENIDAIHERMRPVIGPLMASFGLDADALARNANASRFSAEAMRLAVDTLRATHGDPIAPLRAAGLDDALVAALRRRAGVA